ncbi:MAG: 3-isopropylmalate dehydratase small subunit [Saprospiraceae bacterium]|nr:3-isopropylmalate dehydratase small subunit [Saprospiraceae bacterium]
MSFEKFSDTAVLLPLENVDTDQIIPARFLKATTREGFGENLFCDWRFNKDGSPKPDFVLNQETYKGSILAVGKNFGCGSSREHAAWAIGDYGFKVVISSFFADIFKNNALNNNILPIVAEEQVMDRLFKELQNDPATEILVDLPNEQWSFGGKSYGFEINEYKKECLLKGYDNIDYLLSHKQAVESFEQKHILN